MWGQRPQSWLATGGKESLRSAKGFGPDISESARRNANRRGRHKLSAERWFIFRDKRPDTANLKPTDVQGDATSNTYAAASPIADDGLSDRLGPIAEPTLAYRCQPSQLYGHDRPHMTYTSKPAQL
eukprot:3343802-Alexandrium_andersonii.AAC.1